MVTTTAVPKTVRSAHMMAALMVECLVDKAAAVKAAQSADCSVLRKVVHSVDLKAGLRVAWTVGTTAVESAL
jgi:hypothetical protein